MEFTLAELRLIQNTMNDEFYILNDLIETVDSKKIGDITLVRIW